MDLLRGSSVHCTLSDENICPPHSSQAVNVTTISYYSLYLTALQSFVTWRPHLDRELRTSRPWVLFIFVSPAFDRVSGTYFLGGSDGKESVCNAGDLGLIPGLGRSPGEGNSYPLQYSGLREFHELYSPCGHKESDTTERLSLFTDTVSENWCRRKLHMLGVRWCWEKDTTVPIFQHLWITKTLLPFLPLEFYWLTRSGVVLGIFPLLIH